MLGTHALETGFGPSNVELHRVSAALDLGDITQVIDSAPRINVDHLPVEHQVRYLIDLAGPLSPVAKDDDALQALLTAERKPYGRAEVAGDRAALRGCPGSRAVDVPQAPATAGKKS